MMPFLIICRCRTTLSADRQAALIRQLAAIRNDEENESMHGIIERMFKCLKVGVVTSGFVCHRMRKPPFVHDWVTRSLFVPSLCRCGRLCCTP